MQTTTATFEAARARQELSENICRLIAEGLELPVAPYLLDPDQPLFGRGLELDSLDTLEIVSLLDEEYGVFITDEDRYVFGSVNRLADFVRRNAPAGTSVGD